MNICHLKTLVYSLNPVKSSAVFFTGQVNLEIKQERICNLGVQLQSFGGYGFLIHDESSQSCVDI